MNSPSISGFEKTCNKGRSTSIGSTNVIKSKKRLKKFENKMKEEHEIIISDQEILLSEKQKK